MAAGLAVLAVLVAGGLGLRNQGNSTYVVTAIDNHFHDAHPSAPLRPTTTLVVKNAGRNLHNVSFAGTDFSQDLEPGGQLSIENIGELLGGAGEHPVFCKYHSDIGMTGVIVIA